MINLKKYLDKRICDVETDAENTQTYREFILEGIEEFSLESHDLDKMHNNQLNELMEFIDYLWEK
ncbi:MAG: hypothetical protein ACRCX2_10140 [Paraclostridium sp.]